LMEPLLGFLQLPTLNQSRDAGQLGALCACDCGRPEKSQGDASARENLPPGADARSFYGNILTLAIAQGNPAQEILAYASKTN
jgi:hypothetical protein